MSASIIWNVIDIMSTFCVVIFTLEDLLGGKDDVLSHHVGSIAIFLLWVKFFYFLRIFAPTSAFIRMITEIIKDMGVFSAIYLLANIAFANAYYILDNIPGTKPED